MVRSLHEKLHESFIPLHLLHLIIENQEFWDFQIRLELLEIRETLAKVNFGAAALKLAVSGLPFAVGPVDM